MDFSLLFNTVFNPQKIEICTEEKFFKIINVGRIHPFRYAYLNFPPRFT